MNNRRKPEHKRLASKKSKFNNWVAYHYKKIYQEENYSGVFEKKMEPRINVIIMVFITDIKIHEKTSKQKKEILFQYFLTVLEENKITIKNDLIEDEKFKTTHTIKERKRILSNSTKKPKVNCFYLTNRWLILKSKVHQLYKCGCMKCLKEKGDGELHIDHILPRSKYPELSLNIHNLQILCRDCNMEKSNKNSIDYRTEEQKKTCSLKYN